MDWITTFQEAWWQFLLVALVFTLFGIGTVWMGVSMGGTRFLLTQKGEKTVGHISRVERDTYEKSYHSFIVYTTANGSKIEERILPITWKRTTMKNKVGTEYTLYYNPNKPKQFFCPTFVATNLIGLLCILLGLALIVGALVVGGMTVMALLTV